MDTKKFIDLHMHIGPEIIPRKFTVRSILKYENGKIAGIALKNHFYATSQAIKTEKNRKNLLLIGSVTLNNYVGGLNPDAVYSAAKLSDMPIIVWFPTINAYNFLRKSNYEVPTEWTGGLINSRRSEEIKGMRILYKGKLTKKTLEVLRAIKENNCILATGHISWRECFSLVKEAVRIGIKSIIITHPIYQLINMPIKIQKKLSEYKGVYIEQNYAMYKIDKISLKKIVEQIKIVGARKCIISSDMGQMNNPSSSEAIMDFSSLLIKEGLSEKDIITMGVINPRKILGISTEETLINPENLTKSSKEGIKGEMKKILFVCRSNILRSKIAEAYFNKRYKNKKIKAISAGIRKGGDPLYESEKNVAKEFDLKLSPKITMLNKALINSSYKVILVADNVDPKLVPVKNLVIWKIKDSKEQVNLKVIRKVFLEIIKKVDILLEDIKKEENFKFI